MSKMLGKKSGYKELIRILENAQKAPLRAKFDFATIVSTWFYFGFSPVAPGTIASISVYPIYTFCIFSSSSYDEIQFSFFFISVALMIIGLLAIMKLHDNHCVGDHKSIVIDEVVGQLLTFGISYEALHQISIALSLYCEYSAQFLEFCIGVCAFRFFDIRKPFFIKIIDRKMTGAFGVILDDIAAALLAGASIVICYQVYYQILLRYF